MSGSDWDVADRPEASRFEIVVDGSVAGFAAYRAEPGVVLFTHTEIDPAYEGQGVGGALVRSALDQIRAGGRRVVPRCSFVHGWIERHPEYQDLVVR